jgi:hypothetical protein
MCWYILLRIRKIGYLGLLVALAGCSDARPEVWARSPARAAPDIGTTFDPATIGAIFGRVTWNGDLPVVTPFEAFANPLGGDGLRKRQWHSNPNEPKINRETKGVKDAVVFLRGVDVNKSRSWDHAAVRVEQRAGQLHIHQGAIVGHIGIVRRGSSVELVSRDPFFHSLHAGGAQFFSVTFPDPNQPLERELVEPGLVELCSGAGYYWMRAYLFVADHPYYALTDSSGRFALTQVPPGDHEIVCWLPNWKTTRIERDSESGLIARLFFGRPAELMQKVSLKPGQTQAARFVITHDKMP